MAGQLGKFTMQHFKAWAPNVTKKTHISSIFGTKVQKVQGVMVQLMAFKYGKTLDTMLSKLPVKEFENGEDYVWDVVGSTERIIPLVEARDENGKVVAAGDNNVGAGTQPFYLVFAEHWFFDGETIEGNLGNRYPLRILGDAREEGSNYVYKVETMGGITDGVPAERLLPGEQFSYGAAFVEGGLSRKVGGIRHAVPVSMSNEWSHIRIHHKVSGDMMDDKLAIAVPMNEPTNDGYKVRMVNSWMLNVDFEVEKTFRNYKNYAYAWGRSNRNKNGEYLNIGKSGDAIRTGAGLYEQIEMGNVIYYNDFSLKLVEDALYDLFAGKEDFKDRKVTIRTGEKGGMLFQKAALTDGSGWKSMFDFNGDNLGLISKTTNAAAPYGGALRVAVPQVTEFIAPMGVAITLDIDQSYDNINQSGYKISHPQGGPASSYLFDILDLGSSVNPNIQKCKIKGHPEEWRGYEAGMRNPFTGAWNNDHMSNDEDAAVIHKMADAGIVVWDPTRTMRIMPDILEA